MDDTIAQVRAEAAARVDEAVAARSRAEADADSARAAALAARPPSAAGLMIPIPAWELRPQTRRVETR